MRLNPSRTVVLFAALASAGLAALAASPEAPTGTRRDPLVTGDLAAEQTQRLLGLVAVYAKAPATDNWGACSGTLLTNDWVLTAAHCVSEGGKASGAVIDPPGRLRVTARFGTPEWQQADAIGIIKYLPFDVAIVQLAHPLVVNLSRQGFSNLGRLDARGIYGTGESVHLYGRGLDAVASIDEWNKVTYASGDGLYRSSWAHIIGVRNGVYTLSDAARTMGGDSGGATFRNDGSLIGVHSSCRKTCADGARSCDWSMTAATHQCEDASVNPVQQKIKADIASRAMRDAPAMRTLPHATSITYLEPVVKSEYGTRSRLDVCREFARDCAGEAAAAFCAAQNPALPAVAGKPLVERVAMTAVISDGTVCRGACDAYKAITCTAAISHIDRVGARQH